MPSARLKIRAPLPEPVQRTRRSAQPSADV